MDGRHRATAPVTCLAALLIAAALAAGCGAKASRSGRGWPPAPGRAGDVPARLLREARPIGAGSRFQPPPRGPIAAPCRHRLGGRQAAHVEVFAADRVVVVAAAIGVRGPVSRSAGRIVAARCFAPVVTLEPTGVVLLRPGTGPTLATLFRAWGQRLNAERVASFRTTPQRPVRVYVGGRRVTGPPGAVRLQRHGEVVVEIGPYVPPHSRYTFPPGL